MKCPCWGFCWFAEFAADIRVGFCREMGAKCSGSTSVSKTDRLGSIPDASAIVHDSDCALHNGPALPVGPCDCSVSRPECK